MLVNKEKKTCWYVNNGTTHVVGKKHVDKYESKQACTYVREEYSRRVGT